MADRRKIHLPNSGRISILPRYCQFSTASRYGTYKRVSGHLKFITRAQGNDLPAQIGVCRHATCLLVSCRRRPAGKQRLLLGTPGTKRDRWGSETVPYIRRSFNFNRHIKSSGNSYLLANIFPTIHGKQILRAWMERIGAITLATKISGCLHLVVRVQLDLNVVLYFWRLLKTGTFWHLSQQLLKTSKFRIHRCKEHIQLHRIPKIENCSMWWCGVIVD